MSDFGPQDTSQDPKSRAVRERLGEAGSTLKHEARTFAHVAQDRVRAEAQRGTQAAGRTLGDFANAVRRAGDELGQADQSPASRVVLKAADGLETFSRSLADRDPGDLLNAVRDFGRRHPGAFIGGAVLAGLALGRVARASDRSQRLHDDVQPEPFEPDVPPAPTLLAGETDNLGLVASDGDGMGTDPVATPDAVSSVKPAPSTGAR